MHDDQNSNALDRSTADPDTDVQVITVAVIEPRTGLNARVFTRAIQVSLPE